MSYNQLTGTVTKQKSVEGSRSRDVITTRAVKSSVSLVAHSAMCWQSGVHL